MALSLPPSPSVARRWHAVFPRRLASGRLTPWQIVTLPFWFGSDVPLPVRLPGAATKDTSTPAATWMARQLAALERRFWFSWALSSTLRGAALGGVVALGWLLLAIAGVLPEPTFIDMGICVAFGAVPAIAFGYVNRPGVIRLASMLDRTFGLDQRLITALDGSSDTRASMTIMQRADAANALSQVTRDIGIVGLIPIRECVHVMLIATTIVTCWMFSFDTRAQDDVAVVTIPGYYPASERLADDQKPLPNQQQRSSPSSTPVAGPDDKSGGIDPIDPLQQALGDNTLTQPAANALDEGDVSGAATELDNAAGDIADASQEDRDALADDLENAANQIAAEDPELAERITDAADDIREGGDQARQGVKDLSDIVEEQAPADAAEENSSAETSPGDTAPVGEQQPGGQQPSDDGTGSESESGQPGESDPGAGADAAPGTGEEATSGDQGPAQPGSGGSQGEGSAPESGEAADSTGQGDGNGVPGESQPPGESDSSNPGASEGDSPAQGNNAGSGPPSDSQNETDPTSQPAVPSDDPQPTVAPVPTVEVQPGESGDGTGSGGENLGGNEGTLRIGGASDETVQSGNDASSSSQGSGGGGAPVGSGDASSQPVGPAGPDSNVVPADVEDVVSGYFGGDRP